MCLCFYRSSYSVEEGALKLFAVYALAMKHGNYLTVVCNEENVCLGNGIVVDECVCVCVCVCM